MRTPDPNVMRAVFNDPKLLRQLSNAVLKKDSNKTITVNNKTYVIHTSSTKNKSGDED